MSKVIVVGGGAAGMMAAISAAENGKETLLIEKNPKLGKKLFITGKGRCNVTNACDAEEFFNNVISNPKFLYSSFYGFDNNYLMSCIEEAGCPLKIERGDRVFPVSDHSSDIIKALSVLLTQNKVSIRLGAEAESVLFDETTEGTAVRGVKLTSGEKIFADSVIIATGGISYPSTGSTGDGFRFASQFGHDIVKPVPALVPFNIKEDICKQMQGLSLKNVSLNLLDDKKVVYSGFGEMLFTHFGVSGPLVLSASSYYSKCKNKDKIRLIIDLKPALSFEQLDKRIIRDFEENHTKQFKNVLGNILPSKMVPVMIELSGIDPYMKVCDITKEKRQALAFLIKNMELNVLSLRGFDEAIITQGGINVKTVNPTTMESKLVNGLYFAGEVLDVDALTGGFNLQIAFSTGHLAGLSC